MVLFCFSIADCSQQTAHHVASLQNPQVTHYHLSTATALKLRCCNSGERLLNFHSVKKEIMISEVSSGIVVKKKIKNEDVSIRVQAI